MKKIYLTMAALLSFATTQAQTILEEDFETGVTVSQATPLTRGEGWTTVNSYSGDDYRFNWHNEYRKPTEEGGSWLSGANCASCDGSGSIDLYPGANGPREEILLSPELDLNDTYQLQFMWCVSPMASEDRSRYDLQVRVVTDNNLAGAETVFSIQDERMLRESGVTVFPISTWERHISRVDLSDFKGEKVKLAFVYKMFTQDGNSAYIDDITVKKFTPPTGPVPQVSLDRIVFGDVYVGERFYSDVIRLVNVGKDGLKITGFDLPEGITTTLDMVLLICRPIRKPLSSWLIAHHSPQRLRAMPLSTPQVATLPLLSLQRSRLYLRVISWRPSMTTSPLQDGRALVGVLLQLHLRVTKVYIAVAICLPATSLLLVLI